MENTRGWAEDYRRGWALTQPSKAPENQGPKGSFPLREDSTVLWAEEGRRVWTLRTALTFSPGSPVTSGMSVGGARHGPGAEVGALFTCMGQTKVFLGLIKKNLDISRN